MTSHFQWYLGAVGCHGNRLSGRRFGAKYFSDMTFVPYILNINHICEGQFPTFPKFVWSLERITLKCFPFRKVLYRNILLKCPWRVYYAPFTVISYILFFYLFIYVFLFTFFSICAPSLWTPVYIYKKLSVHDDSRIFHGSLVNDSGHTDVRDGTRLITIVDLTLLFRCDISDWRVRFFGKTETSINSPTRWWPKEVPFFICWYVQLNVWLKYCLLWNKPHEHLLLDTYIISTKLSCIKCYYLWVLMFYHVGQRSWLAIFHFRQPMAFFSHSSYGMPGLLLLWMFYSKGGATFI